MTNRTKASAFSSLVVVLALAGLSKPAQATQWDKKTIMTVNEPIEVPNLVLEPGTYVFKLLDDQGDRHVVQIFDKDEKHLLTTILAIPNYRLTPTGKTDFAFWETPAGQPRALRAWFYPGDNFGQEFAYPKTTIAKIATNNSNATVPEATETVAETTTAATPAPMPAAEPQPEPAPAPQVVASAEPVPAPPTDQTPAPQQLPQTASDFPLIALVGFGSLIAFAVLTVRSKRSA
jgi:hypothetical protein